MLGSDEARGQLDTHLFVWPVGWAVYLDPEPCWGGAETNAAFPAFRFRFRRFLSRAERPLKSSSESSGTGREGIGVDELERSVGETAGGDRIVSSSALMPFSISVSGSTSGASSFSQSISSLPKPSRKSSPRRPIASFRAFLTSEELARIAEGLTNSFPEDASRRVPRSIKSFTEKFGNSGIAGDSSAEFIWTSGHPDGSHTGIEEKI